MEDFISLTADDYDLTFNEVERIAEECYNEDGTFNTEEFYNTLENNRNNVSKIQKLSVTL